MSAKYDVYSFCGCGSGKKLKFCCLEIIDDILKIVKQQEQRQLDRAIQGLERIEEKHPGYPWTAVLKASVLLEINDPEGAYHVVEELLKNDSDHQLAMLLRADSAFYAWGFDVAKPALYQTFYIGLERYTNLLSHLAGRVAVELTEEKRFLAARQYLGLAMRLSSEEDQQQAFMGLMEFDGNSKIPYPLRSVHKLDSYKGTAEQAETIARADHFSTIGQWQAASQEYEKLTEADSENGSLWKNLGLCRAWDGNEKEAAIALHKAATLIKDYDEAVEIETVAQAIDLYATGKEVQFMEVDYGVKDIDELQSALDFHPRFQEESQTDTDLIEYTILDRLSLEELDNPDIDIDELPREIGGLVIQEFDEETLVTLTAAEGEKFKSSQEFFEEVAGEWIEEADGEPLLQFTVKEYNYQLMNHYSVPINAPLAIKGKLRNRLVNHHLETTWAKEPHFALDGQSPEEAAKNSDNHVKLAAAIYLLDATSELVLGTFSKEEMFRQFNLPEPSALQVVEDQPLHLLSNVQVHRLNLKELTDEQLRRVLDRSRVTNHSPFVYHLLMEAISRPELVSHLDMQQVYSTLATNCQERNKVEEVLKWIEAGINSANEGENAFEDVLQWNARKLSALLYQTDDTDFRNQLQYMRDYYGSKMPEYLASLEEALTDILGKELPAASTDKLEPVNSSSEETAT